MKIHLFIENNMYDHLSRWCMINKVSDLNAYINILPKSIEINLKGKFKILIINKIIEIFNPYITSFNEVSCRDSKGNFQFLSNKFKKVNIYL